MLHVNGWHVLSVLPSFSSKCGWSTLGFADAGCALVKCLSQGFLYMLEYHNIKALPIPGEDGAAHSRRKQHPTSRITMKPQC